MEHAQKIIANMLQTFRQFPRRIQIACAVGGALALELLWMDVQLVSFLIDDPRDPYNGYLLFALLLQIFVLWFLVEKLCFIAATVSSREDNIEARP